MIYNYLLVAWRNILKNKTFSLINIFGLAIGVAAFLMIANYIRFEYSYDDSLTHLDRIYRVPMMIKEKDGKEQTFAFTFPAVATAMKKDFPEVEETVRFRRQGGIVKYKDIKIFENRLYWVDPSVFTVFDFPFDEGSAVAALVELNDVVITASTAKKYFGTENPMGKAVRYRNEDFIVKGVLKDLPANSHLQFNFLFNYKKYIQLTEGRAETSWGWSDFYTYILLKPGTDAQIVQSKMPDFAQRYLGKDMNERGFQQYFEIQPIKDIHLKSTYDYELTGNGDLGYLKYLGIAALFILLIAWINYVNLSTARSIDRAREVGVRKVIGAGKMQLISQFLSESFLINFIGILSGIALFILFLPSFSTFSEKDLSYLKASDFAFWLLALGIFILGTIGAAFYPAFVLSSFQPIHTLKSSKGSSGMSAGKNILRKSLVVLQFATAIVLIAGALGIYRQLKYMQSKDLGINIDQTLVLNQTGRVDSSDIPSFNSLVNDLENFSGITSVTASTSVPGSEVGASTDFNAKGSLLAKRCRVFGIDKKFIPSYGLNIVAGRNISNDRTARDTSHIVNVLLNETGIKVLGFKSAEDAIGKEIEGAGLHCQVIGVVKDYHQESLQYDFDPIVFYPEEERGFQYFSLKLNTTNLPVLMDFVKSSWNKNFADSPFNYFFLDEQFDNQYKTDRQFTTVLWLFTLIAIVIACLGLFGLSMYTLAKRTKEISIRKVLGASMTQITTLMTKEYIQLIVVSGIIALPIGYILLNKWLTKYVFRIDIDILFFILPILMIFVIALGTVLLQSIKAALSNPVKSLRME